MGQKIRFLILIVIVGCVRPVLAQGWSLANQDLHSTVVKIKTSFGHCTGTRISNEGHILTARHCFNACLIQKEYTQPEVLFSEFGYQSPVLHKVNSYAGKSCEVELNGENVELELISGSSAFMIPSEQSSLFYLDREMYISFLERRYFHNGDYIIVKHNTSTVASCQRIEISFLQESGVSVDYNGYPRSSTNRPAGLNSDGMSLLNSQGVTTDSILGSDCLSGAENVESLKLKYDRPELVLSTVDLLPGASGSLLRSSLTGEAIGVLNSLYQQNIIPHQQYCAGTAVALTMNEIINETKKQVSQWEFSRIFKCD